MLLNYFKNYVTPEDLFGFCRIAYTLYVLMNFDGELYIKCFSVLNYTSVALTKTRIMRKSTKNTAIVIAIEWVPFVFIIVQLKGLQKSEVYEWFSSDIMDRFFTGDITVRLIQLN